MQEKSRIRNLGMFDLFKGIGMIGIIAVHSFFSGFSYEELNPAALVFLTAIWTVSAGAIATFFIVSGFGFRPMSMGRQIRLQTRLMLKYFAYMMVGVSALHIFTRYFITHSLRAAVRITWNVTGGVLLALPMPRQINGILYYSCGTMWYIAALFEGVIVLNILMNVRNEKLMQLLIFGVVVCGWLAGKAQMFWFSLSQGLIAVGFLYIGYLIKKRVLCPENHRKLWNTAALGAFCIEMAAAIYRRSINNMADGVWNLGVISIILTAVMGIRLFSLFLDLGARPFPGREVIEFIGRNTILILSLHSIEWHGIPWYLLQERTGSGIWGRSIVFILRVLFIIGMMYLLRIYNRRAYRLRQWLCGKLLGKG